MSHISVSEMRNDFPSTLNKAAYQGERIILKRHGKELVAVISLEDLALLERLEDEEDIREAKHLLSDSTQKPISYAKVRKELGLI